MTQFNFTTNIEKRMPTTGKVFCIDRMTSDYAYQHPFDVDGFIESVYQEFAGTEFEESRETLRSIWTAVLSVTSPRGDASIYPNKDGRKRAAAMKVWHKAGDYWRSGFRHGDTLPDMVPMTKITRLDGGAWIALFPKDEHLLESEECRENAAIEREPSNSLEWPSVSGVAEGKSEESTEHEPELAVEQPTDPAEPAVTEPVRNQSEPQQLDLFAFQQLQQENERLRLQLSQQQSQPRPRRQRQKSSRQSCSVRSGSVAASQAVCPAIPLQEDNHDRQSLLKAVGMVAAATVALLVIYETGLLIPLGLIGLATGGLLK